MSDTQTSTEKPILDMKPVEGCDPVVGLGLRVLQDCRRRTLGELEGLKEDWLDIDPPMGHNTLASILYHMASTEIYWLYTVLQQEVPGDMLEVFPDDDRDDKGDLARLKVVTLEDYMEKMRIARNRFLELYKVMSPEEYHRPRDIQNGMGEIDQITPERVLYHLVNHDAEHRGELMFIIQHFREQEQSGKAEA